jgi:hypothetical protein
VHSHLLEEKCLNFFTPQVTLEEDADSQRRELERALQTTNRLERELIHLQKVSQDAIKQLEMSSKRAFPSKCENATYELLMCGAHVRVGQIEINQLEGRLGVARDLLLEALGGQAWSASTKWVEAEKTGAGNDEMSLFAKLKPEWGAKNESADKGGFQAGDRKGGVPEGEKKWGGKKLAKEEVKGEMVEEKVDAGGRAPSDPMAELPHSGIVRWVQIVVFSVPLKESEAAFSRRHRVISWYQSVKSDVKGPTFILEICIKSDVKSEPEACGCLLLLKDWALSFIYTALFCSSL